MCNISLVTAGLASVRACGTLEERPVVFITPAAMAPIMSYSRSTRASATYSKTFLAVANDRPNRALIGFLKSKAIGGSLHHMISNCSSHKSVSEPLKCNTRGARRRQRAAHPGSSAAPSTIRRRQRGATATDAMELPRCDLRIWPTMLSYLLFRPITDSSVVCNNLSFLLCYLLNIILYCERRLDGHYNT
eukprot:6193401-Pleurochrysis_carterae.AAC.1